MRKLALMALAAGLGLGFAGAAMARPWADPGGRFTVDAPAGWSVQQQRGANPGDNLSYVILGTAANECQIKAQPNPNTASADADDVHRTAGQSAQFGAEYWVAAANSIPSIFPNNSAQFVSSTTETNGPWPIQRATLRAGEQTVHGALQLRPGVDILTMCLTFDGPDRVEIYDGVIRSIGHSNDATWAAAIAAAARAD